VGERAGERGSGGEAKEDWEVVLIRVGSPEDNWMLDLREQN